MPSNKTSPDIPLSNGEASPPEDWRKEAESMANRDGHPSRQSDGADSPVLTSKLLRNAGFLHAFSTRNGGVSTGAHSSLNLSFSVGDQAARVTENIERFRIAAGLKKHTLFQVNQVHGNQVHSILDGSDIERVQKIAADAVLGVKPSHAVGIRTADCVPVLLADPDTGAVCAIHAGWRGIAAQIIQRGIEALQTVPGYQSPSRLLVAIGPHIGPCCFEVDRDVAEQIEKAVPPSESTRPPATNPSTGKAFPNLGQVATQQLRSKGVQLSNVEHVGGCTFCQKHRFFSFRRDGKGTGHQLSVIAARAV